MPGQESGCLAHPDSQAVQTSSPVGRDARGSAQLLTSLTLSTLILNLSGSPAPLLSCMFQNHHVALASLPRLCVGLCLALLTQWWLPGSRVKSTCGQSQLAGDSLITSVPFPRGRISPTSTPPSPERRKMSKTSKNFRGTPAALPVKCCSGSGAGQTVCLPCSCEHVNQVPGTTRGFLLYRAAASDLRCLRTARGIKCENLRLVFRTDLSM